MSSSIYLTVPNRNGWTHKTVDFAVNNMLTDGRYRIRHAKPTHCPYVDNLHACMNDFLEGGEDYWMSIDDDNPPLNNPLDLIEYDCDLIGLPTPVWNNSVKGDRPWYFNALDAVEGGYTPHTNANGLQEVDAIGSGCFIVARRVIYKLKDDMPFMRQWAKNGRVEIGCDYSFCRKVKAAGFRVWAHYDYICDHYNELPLMEVIRAFGAMMDEELSNGRN